MLTEFHSAIFKTNSVQKYDLPCLPWYFQDKTMDQRNSTSFSITEEAFLLRSLKEVVNVWARGCGQATFNLEILDGGADLKLGFQLGRPSDPHPT